MAEYRSLPGRGYAGITVVGSATGGTFSQWKVVAPRLREEILIAGVSFEYNSPVNADTTFGLAIEIGFGEPGYEVTHISVPYSVRSDTAVGYFLKENSRFFLPELKVAPKGTTISIRFAMQQSLASTLSGVKLIFLGEEPQIEVTEQKVFENSNFFRVGSGMSVSERGGCFR